MGFCFLLSFNYKGKKYQYFFSSNVGKGRYTKINKCNPPPHPGGLYFLSLPLKNIMYCMISGIMTKKYILKN